MRISFTLLLVVTVLAPVGCNSDLRCRRETALMRAEYLDLEDKYYTLLAQSGRSTIIDDAVTVTSGYENAAALDSGLPVGSGVIADQAANPSGMLSTPEVTYYDSSPVITSGQVISSDNEIIGSGAVSGGTIYGGSINGESVMTTPTLAAPPSGESGATVEQSPAQETPGADMNQGLPENLFDESGSSTNDDLPAPKNVDPGESGGVSILEPDSPRLQAGFATSARLADRVAEVKINSSVSRGENTDAVAGDDELKILLQPMTAAGKVVEQAGNLTISVVDPAADQGRQQVGYWEFVRSETELFFARDEFGNRGLLLQLPWNDVPPTNANLTVYVRFETSSGRVIETTDTVTIDPPAAQLENAGFNDVDLDPSRDWYKGQSRRRRSRSLEDQGASTISTRPIRSKRSPQQDEYYRRPGWKPVR